MNGWSTVKGLSTRRGPANGSRAAVRRDRGERARTGMPRALTIQAQAAPFRERGGRPTKKDRRDLVRLATKD